MKTTKLFKLYIFLFVSCTAFAQEFTVASKIAPVKESGLHSVPLTPEFRAHADVNLYGLRLLDSKKKEVPYWINSEQKSAKEYGFAPYPIIYKKTVADTLSQIVVKNEKGVKWDNITLAIANTDAQKTYSISGSYDDAQWFGLVNNQVLDGLSSATDTLVYKTLSMPVNAYRYLRINFSDKKTLPINIIAAGKITGSKGAAPAFQQAYKPFVKTLQLAIEKKTRISISFNTPVSVSRIQLAIAGPSLYNRNVTLLLPRTRKQRKKEVPYFEEAGRFTLSSSAANSIDVNLTESAYILEIDNRDNPPLDITAVTVLQLPINLVADLKAGEQYTLMGGNPNLPQADYDLGDFKEKLQSGLPEATLLKPAIITPKAKGLNGSKSAWIMWVCIAAGALILAYFCISLVRDMKKGQGKVS